MPRLSIFDVPTGYSLLGMLYANHGRDVNRLEIDTEDSSRPFIRSGRERVVISIGGF